VLRLIASGADTKGRPFLVSEYCRQGSLDDWMERDRPNLTVVEALDLFLPIVRGVANAHRAGIIHRDLKPANIFLREDRSPVVGDFGLCFFEEARDLRLTHSREVIGSRWFAAPEVRNGRLDDVKPAVDIYSLGKILYWMLRGGEVFDREQHRTEEYDLVPHFATLGPVEPTLSLEEAQSFELVNELLDEMIVLQPERRIPDASELLERVRILRQLVEVGARPVLLHFPQRCTFCKQGVYRFQTNPSSTDLDNRDKGRNLGLHEPAGSGWWLIATCTKCGHVQLFRPDLVPGAVDRWRRQPRQEGSNGR
jgi:serine/threonine protein kinase